MAMNLVRTPVASNSEPLNLSGRPDKNTSGKGDNVDFAQTLGAVDRAETSKQVGSGVPVNSTPPQTAAGDQPVGQGTGEAASGQQNASSQQAVVSISMLSAPALPDLSQIADAVIDDGAPPPEGDAQIAVPTMDLEAMTQTLEGLKDLAQLVHAVTKTASEADAKPADPDLPDDAAADDARVTDADLAAGADILTLLAANAALNGQSGEMQAPPPGAAPASVPSGNVDAIGKAGDDVLDAPKSGSATTVRLEKQDAPAIDLHIDTDEDGSLKLDASMASGDASNVVQVVESRRYIGLAPSSNAAAVTAAMSGDPDWSTAFSSQAAGKPLITSTGQVVHTLKIQMNPVEMGHVTAAMKLVGDQLSVHLTAHTLKGYAELQKDSSAILESLKSQGFTVEQVSVSLAASPERTDNTANNKQPQPDQGQQMGAQQGNQRGHEDRPQDQVYRQPKTGLSEELTNHDSTLQPAPVAGGSSLRSGQLYL